MNSHVKTGAFGMIWRYNEYQRCVVTVQDEVDVM